MHAQQLTNTMYLEIEIHLNVKFRRGCFGESDEGSTADEYIVFTNRNTFEWTIKTRLLRWISCMLNCFLSLQGGLCSLSSIMHHPWWWQYGRWFSNKKDDNYDEYYHFEMKVIMMLVSNCINYCAYLYTLRSIENQPRLRWIWGLLSGRWWRCKFLIIYINHHDHVLLCDHLIFTGPLHWSIMHKQGWCQG